MKAIVLAAGKGERLRPITETRPKPLIPVLCKPLLQWQLEALERLDIVDEVVVVASYLKDKIEDFINTRKYGLKIKLVDQGREMGTGDAVLKGVKDFSVDEDVLIIYGDLFLSDWSILEKLVMSNGNTVLAVRIKDPREYGVLIVENGLLKGLVEKPEKPPSNLVNAGIYKLSVHDIVSNSDIDLSPRGELEFTDILLKIAQKKPVRVLNIASDLWIDIGMPWNVIEANKMALKNVRREINGVVEGNVTIRGDVYVGENARVRSGSYIEGPVYIDRDVDIGPNARIRPYTVVCRGSRIGFSVEVKESVIMEHVHVSHLSYVGDSIICEGVNFGAGTITANLRFDDKPVKVTIKGKRISSGRRKLGAIVGAYVKTGINVSLMPGVKVGSYSWIAPGAVVNRDIPSKKFYRIETKYFIDDLKSS